MRKQVPLAVESAVGSRSSTQRAIWMYHAHDGFRWRSQLKTGRGFSKRRVKRLSSYRLSRRPQSSFLQRSSMVKSLSPHRIRVLVAPTWTDRQRQRSCAQQTYDDPIPSQRSPHGARSLHEEDVDEGPGRVVDSTRKCESGCPGEWRPSCVRPCAVSGSLTWDILPQALEAGRAADLAHHDAKQQGSIPDKVQAPEAAKAGRAPEDWGLLVTNRLDLVRETSTKEAITGATILVADGFWSASHTHQLFRPILCFPHGWFRFGQAEELQQVSIFGVKSNISWRRKQVPPA